MKPKSGVRVTVAVLLLSVIPGSGGASFWEFLIGPKLGIQQIREEKSSLKTTEQIVTSYGYRLDTHLVASKTGHILTLHRVSRGRRKIQPNRTVAFIHHGLFGSSDMWLLRGPHKDLPYILADSGYDVWLFNARGNVYSRKHKFLNPDKDPKYWDFGIQDVGFYDLPVTIDYILNLTSQKDLFYVGHSIGCSSGFIMCSLLPEYNKKIRLFVALAPVANVKHSLNPFHRILFSLSSVFLPYFESIGIQDVFPRRATFNSLLGMLCEDNSPMQKLCLRTVFSVVGDDISQLDTKTFPDFLQYYPAGTSLKIVENVVNYLLSGVFSPNFDDCGIRYNLSRVTAPVSVYFGPSDLLVTKEDVEDLCLNLSNCVGQFEVPYKHFNHLDFVLAINARSLLYDSLLYLIEKYKF